MMAGLCTRLKVLPAIIFQSEIYGRTFFSLVPVGTRRYLYIYMLNIVGVLVLIYVPVGT